MPDQMPLTEKERILFRHIADMAERVLGEARFTAFLNERERQIAEMALKGYSFSQYRFFGGYAEAQRKVFGVGRPGCLLDDSDFPVKAIILRHGKGEKLSHRMVLGSAIALGISRESIGDILPHDGVCHILVLKSVAPVVIEELRRVGGIGIRADFTEFSELVPSQEFVRIRSTVSSLRIDCLVSMLTGLSREKSAMLIRSGQVSQSYREQENNSARFGPGDVVSVRGYGKFIVDSIESQTRKGRFPVQCRKYL